MVKIVHIINNLNRGGAETLLLNIIRGLNAVSEELDIRVLILEDKQHLTPQFRENNIPVDLVDCLQKRFIFKVVEIAKYLKKIRPDVVHTHLLNADKVGLPAAFIAGVKKRYCSVHNMEQDTKIGDKRARIIAKLFAHTFIAVSNSARDFCIKNGLYPAKKIVVIYNVPGFQIKDQNVRSRTKKMSAIHVARLHEQKGQKYLVEAFRILKERDVDCHLTIYGVGKEESVLKKIIDNNNLKNVTLAGQSDDIPTKLQEHEFFISSSLWEGFNMAMVEALSAGLPVIATDIPPHREILTQFGEYDLLAKPGSAESIADKVEQVLAMDEDTYCHYSELSIKLSQKFSYDEMIKSYKALYI